MTDSNMAMIAARMFGAPLMVEPRKARVIAEAFGPRVLNLPAPAAQADQEGFKVRAGSLLHEGMSEELTRERGGFIRHGAVAIIPVIGSLVRRGSWLGQSSGMTSYEGLRAQIKSAAADETVRALAFEFDSPGGEAAGAFELADLVREVRREKPCYAFCAEEAYSAAYALASQCDQIVVPEFGGAGSIGVIAMHIDQSAALEMDGLKVTIIRSGAHKAKGNSIEPLPEGLLAEWQAECDRMRVEFCSLVGAGRGGRLTAAAAMATEARCFSGSAAVSLGVADIVANPKKAFDAMVASVNETGAWDGSVPATGASQMSRSMGCETGAATPDTKKEVHMTTKTQSAPEPNVETDAQANAGAVQAVAKPAVDAAGIIAKVARAGLSAQFAQDLIAEGVSMEVATDRIIDAVADKKADGGDIINHSVTANVTHDVVDRTKAGMVEALSAKANLEGGKRNEFSSMSLREMARFSLETRGLRPAFQTPMQMVGAAFVPSMAGGMHGTSDFGEILANVANKSMLMGYREQEETFELWTKAGILTDFKPGSRVGTGLFEGLDVVKPGAEFTYGTMGDFAEPIVLATYGKLFAISRQAIINDDLSAFTQVPERMGRAAKRTIGNLAYGVLSLNANMSDGNALFSAEHSNLAASGSVPSETAISNAMAAMMNQKPRGTKDEDAVLNISPRYLLHPPKLRSQVFSTLESEFTPDTGDSKATRRKNSVYKAATPIRDARLKGNAWYLAADPSAFDTVEIAYLDGVQEPFIEQQDGWTVDGTEMKVRIDAGAAANAWEGLYKNPGA